MHRSGGSQATEQIQSKAEYRGGEGRRGVGYAWPSPGKEHQLRDLPVLPGASLGCSQDSQYPQFTVPWNLKHAVLVIKCHGHCQLFRLFSPCLHLKLVTGMPRLHLPSLLLKEIISSSFLPTKALCASRPVQGERGC